MGKRLRLIFGLTVAAILALVSFGGASVHGESLAGVQPAISSPGGSAYQPMRSGDDQQLLESLYSDLAKASDELTAIRFAASIVKVWMRSGSDTVDLLTRRANTAMQAADDKTAEDLLDAIVEIAPNFVEGWNRRATYYFTKKDYVRSMADVQRVLALDPRHFGALSGMGAILQDTGQDAAALAIYREALKVHPFLSGARQAAEKLQTEIEGRGI